MANLKRQRSWHEDFSRNFLRLFSRSRSVEQEKTDTEAENGEEHEDDSTVGQSDEADTAFAPLHHLTMEPAAQTLGQPEQDRLLEAHSVDDPEHRVQDNDADRDPLPVTPSALEPSSPPPPVDGFFRRLGSLFLFGRAEPGGADGQSQPGTVSEAQGAVDTQHTDPKTLLTGSTEAQTIVEEGGEQRLKPTELSQSQELSNSAAGPEVKSTGQAKQDIENTQLQEEVQADQDDEVPVDSQSSDEEQERRRALASPPVVTHVTYRGLREIRKMRRKQEVRLHSPISEGEEGQHGAGVGMSAPEEEVETLHGAIAGSPCVAASGEGLNHQRHVSQGSSNAPSGSHMLEDKGGDDSALSQSALQTHTVARTQPAGLESDLALVVGTSCPGEKAVCLVADGGSEMHVDGLEHLEMASDRETQSLFPPDVLLDPLTAQPPETSHSQLSDTATNSNTHLTDITTVPSSHTCFCLGSDIASNCCQETSSVTQLDVQRPENNQTNQSLSSKAETSGQAACKAELVPEDETTQFELAEEQSALEEETLQLESKKMVDDILKNALAALEKIDASNRESETTISEELNEGAETLMLMSAGNSMGGSASVECMFREHLPVQADGNPQLNLSDDTLGGRAQADGCRSTPSSGYESIAGSDTDIRSMTMNSDITTSVSGPFGTLCSEPELKEESETEERELCMDGSPVCQNDEIRQNFVHSTSHLKVNLEEREGPEGTEANNELLFQYDLSDSNISHKTNIPSAQQAISESLSGVNKGEEQCAVEEHGVHVCVTQRDNDHSGPQNAAKVNTESNNYGNALGLDSGDASSIINNVDLKQVQSISESLSPTGMRNADSYQLPHISEIRDFSGKEDRPNLSVRQSHVADETLALHLEKPKLASQDPQSGHAQGLLNYAKESDEEPDFALVKTYLATVVEDGPDIEMPSAVPGCSTIKVFVCSATDDQSQDHKPDLLTGPSLHSPGRLASLPISVRAHLDIPGTSSRPQTTDLHQVPGGFTVISEEEELDTVFVNDTGPLLSPSTKRAKAYPFSLSPIYEEDSGREDTSRDDLLHVPPATEEEQRSVEQQASSILSLLQSVSERLQSSVYSESEESEEKLEEPESPQRFLRPLWDRYEDDDNDEDAVTDEQSSLLLQQQLTGIRFHSEELELEPAADDCTSSSFLPDQKTTSGILFEEPGAQHCKPTLNNNINNVVRKANTPFYEYLKSNIVPSLDTEKQASKAFHHNEGSPTSSTLTEMEAFGKINPRPTLLHIYAGATPSGTRRDVCEDVEDASQVLFPQEATIQARRGCWLLYVEPGYRGSCIVLEEGQTMRTTGETTKSEEHSAPAPLSVGSIKRAVKDDTVPEIHLSSASNPERERVCLHSEADHVDANGPVHLSDLSVRSGCWLAYDGTAFTGNHTVLEARGLTTPVLQNSPISCVRSLRPLRMGGLRVRNPLDPKVVLFAQPLFQGECRELLDNTPSLGPESGLAQVSSLRVAGGVWVGYSYEKYRGQQCVLEEGEYSDCSAFFSEPGLTLRSCRFLQADFIEPEVSLKSSGVQMEILDQDVADLQQNGLEEGTDAIHVKSGVWVAYSGRYYTGEQCVLEKGQHPGTLDWGSSTQSSPLSIRPVRREVCGEEKAPKFLLRVYSKPGFAGESREFGTEVADCGGLIPMSFRVILGSWLLYDEQGYCGNQFVLGEGFYPDLTSCGSMATGIKSFKPIPYSFSEPSISLFSLSSFEGLETVSDSPIETMDNFFTQSVKVNNGLWVVYEFGQFRGRQMLLQMGEYPCWGEYSSWDTIGSLQPLRQRRTYMQVRNGALGMALTAERTSDPLSPAKLLLRSADRSLDTQHWIYSQALLKSKVGKGCLSVIGGKASVGARVALWEEHGRIHQRWRLNKNGTISPHLDLNLVLDRRGGSGIDKDHLILSELCTDKASQYWDIEVL